MQCNVAVAMAVDACGDVSDDDCRYEVILAV